MNVTVDYGLPSGRFRFQNQLIPTVTPGEYTMKSGMLRNM